MAITKRQKKTQDDFINSAPDGVASTDKPRRVRKGNKVQITLTITEQLLDRVDQLADKLGQSRASVINLAIHQSMEQGITLNSNV